MSFTVSTPPIFLLAVKSDSVPISRIRLGRAGFTLVELLVVIAIVGVLLALLIPAVQSAREASRRSSCANNLHQLGTAVGLHESSWKIFPTGGWGADWVGDPNRGFDSQQPGGWVYNLLPYIEEKSLREIGKGLPDSARRAAVGQLLQSPIEILNCPSRRPSQTYPYTGPQPLQNADPPETVAKSDYAINSDVSYQKSEVPFSEIQRKRGLSKTVLIGEKTVQKNHYADGQSTGDTLTMYQGDCDDIRRKVSGPPIADAEGGSGFGSAHPEGCNVAMCDGAVRFVIQSDNLQP